MLDAHEVIRVLKYQDFYHGILKTGVKQNSVCVVKLNLSKFKNPDWSSNTLLFAGSLFTFTDSKFHFKLRLFLKGAFRDLRNIFYVEIIYGSKYI